MSISNPLRPDFLLGRPAGPFFAPESGGGAALLERPETAEDSMIDPASDENVAPATTATATLDAPVEASDAPAASETPATDTAASETPAAETTAAPAAPAVETPKAASADSAPDAEEEVTTSFADLGLSPLLLESIAAVGYTAPSPIQERTIPALLNGQDVIAQAQTGSGKTAAFGLPIIESIDRQACAAFRRSSSARPANSRFRFLKRSQGLGRHKESKPSPIYGGQPYERQFRGLQRGVQIVVGTPGRVMDHMRRGTLDLDQPEVLRPRRGRRDARHGLRRGHRVDPEQVPAERQTALFSATMPPRIAELARKYMNEPERISVRRQADDGAEDPPDLLRGSARSQGRRARRAFSKPRRPARAMIFCRTKHGRR